MLPSVIKSSVTKQNPCKIQFCYSFKTCWIMSIVFLFFRFTYLNVPLENSRNSNSSTSVCKLTMKRENCSKLIVCLPSLPNRCSRIVVGAKFLLCKISERYALWSGIWGFEASVISWLSGSVEVCFEAPSVWWCRLKIRSSYHETKWLKFPSNNDNVSLRKLTKKKVLTTEESTPLNRFSLKTLAHMIPNNWEDNKEKLHSIEPKLNNNQKMKLR